jgi:hypothetical protein
MFIHPSIRLEIVRQRQQDFLARGERDRTADAAHAGRHEDRGRQPRERVTLRQPKPTTTACRPQGVNA